MTAKKQKREKSKPYLINANTSGHAYRVGKAMGLPISIGDELVKAGDAHDMTRGAHKIPRPQRPASGIYEVGSVVELTEEEKAAAEAAAADQAAAAEAAEAAAAEAAAAKPDPLLDEKPKSKAGSKPSAKG